jgi:uncharacterized membrane protein
MSDLRNLFPGTRRQFLLASACVAANAVAASLQGPNASAAESAGILLQPSGRTLFRVRLEMEVQGNVQVPRNALASRKAALTLPILSNATFDYEERYRGPADASNDSSADGEVTYVERYYHEAASTSKLNRSSQSTTLRDSVRQTIVRRESLPEMIYSPDDYFQRDELELLRLPVTSVSLEQLLPPDRVQVNSQYSLSREAMASVLNLSSVEVCEVSAKIVSITQQEARIQLGGKLDGSVDGVPTTIRVTGKLTFDRQAGACTWLAIGLHETRDIGVGEPGFDISATLKMVRQPLDAPVALDSPATPVDVTAPIPADRLYVELVSEQVGLTAMMDRRWRMISDVPGNAMMRMIDTDRSIAQCDLRPLATLAPGTQWTLEAFQLDVRKTLGEQLTNLLEAEESVSPAGLRVLRVVAQGSVQGIPIQWVMQHFSDDSGRRLLAVFTLEGHQAATFAGADAQLAATLRFRSTVTSEPQSSEPQSSEPQPSKRVESPTSSDQQVARSRSRVPGDDHVQSASDLR